MHNAESDLTPSRPVSADIIILSKMKEYNNAQERLPKLLDATADGAYRGTNVPFYTRKRTCSSHLATSARGSEACGECSGSGQTLQWQRPDATQRSARTQSEEPRGVRAQPKLLPSSPRASRRQSTTLLVVSQAIATVLADVVLFC